MQQPNMLNEINRLIDFQKNPSISKKKLYCHEKLKIIYNPMPFNWSWHLIRKNWKFVIWSKDWFARMEIRFLEGKNKSIVNGGFFFVHIIKTV